MKKVNTSKMSPHQLSAYFEAVVLVDYYEWRAAFGPHDRRGRRYRGLITRCGGVGAAKRLLRSRSNRKKRDEFGIEYLVVDARFRRLFTAWELAEAQDRIDRAEAA
jgi:hypothetical protein